MPAAVAGAAVPAIQIITLNHPGWRPGGSPGRSWL